MSQSGRHIEIRGVVQGVGFRPWVYQLAQRERIRGAVRNDCSGVVIDAFGREDDLDRFTDRLQQEAPPAAVVREISWTELPYQHVSTFTIVSSESSGEREVSIPADLAICDDCVAEVFDPADRRHLYPFTNCTNCGPRYSIVTGVPYDRAKTTMTSFTMCARCQAEYDDPTNRRFHAQPNACPQCGPQVVVTNPEGRPIEAADPIRFAARAIAAQLIVAVKGLGGFHLACDATSSTAVERLRQRKHREAKPLAVMVADVAAAEEIAFVTAEERRLLTSRERPIVLLRRRPDAKLSAQVCGDNPLVGVFLPYTALHHVLTRNAKRPLVMTSGNVADEPMVYTNAEAVRQLGSIADVFLMHNRDIECRIDDSVARVVAGAPVVFRRARGYVPRGVSMKRSFAEPVLAVGAHLKNAVCIGANGGAFLGPHVGDLESVETLRAFEASIEKMKAFVGVQPKIIAHDLHPDYYSTRYAVAQAGVRTVGVQHHHAHVASVMAEHGVEGPVVGVAYDGTGFGTDGTSWGGEILVARYDRFERFATLRPVPLPGGDQAIRQVWRIALAMLDDAYDGTPPLNAIPLFRAVPRRGIDAMRRMIATGLNTPRARGLGRYFDALGAIGLDMSHAHYEGEVAFRWNMAADDDERGRYPVVVRDGIGTWEIDLRPMIKAAVEDLIHGKPASAVSARFHNTIAEVTVEVVRAASVTIGGAPIVLSGGCFQNARLANDVTRALAGETVLMNRSVPPGDGGIALGQAVVADATLRAEAAVVPACEEEVPACV